MWTEHDWNCEVLGGIRFVQNYNFATYILSLLRCDGKLKGEVSPVPAMKAYREVEV